MQSKRYLISNDNYICCFGTYGSFDFMQIYTREFPDFPADHKVNEAAKELLFDVTSLDREKRWTMPRMILEAVSEYGFNVNQFKNALK